MKQKNHRYFAPWMLVPAILIVPACISGLSIWNDWGPHWLLASMAVTGVLLALIVDSQHTLRWVLIGAVLGVAASPVLLLFSKPSLDLFGWWVTAAAVGTALLAPLMCQESHPPRKSGATHSSAPDDAKSTRERLLPGVSQQPKT